MVFSYSYGEEERCIQGFGGADVRERDRLGHLVVDWGVILRWILSKSVWRVWTGLIWLRIGTSGRLL
jgi:hypothetical protein